MTALKPTAALLALLLLGPALAGEPRRLPPTTGALACYPETAASPVATQPPVIALAGWAPCESPAEPLYEVGTQFDKGVFIRSTDLRARPYAIYLGGRLQLRHTGFTRDEKTWTDSAGVTRAIRNRNELGLERARLNISGTAVDPRLSYYLIFDGDSDGASQVDQLAYLFTYEIDPALKVRVGRWKAANDREWLQSSRFLRLTDRAMATEYFRVGFAEGLWLLGDAGDWHYEASLTNALRGVTRGPFQSDDNLAVAATCYCDPLGDFGPGEADYACHAAPVVRFGGGVAFNKSDDRRDVGFALGDDNFLRLSDGTRLSEVGALAPGVQVIGERSLQAAFDAAIKYRGWSLSAEVFLRRVQDLKADGPLTIDELNDYGFRLDGGVFLVPQRFDVNARMSQVSGLRGDAHEYSLGCNWYFGNGERNGRVDDRVNKFSLDVTEIKGSPTTSTPADLIAGDDGVLFRTQVQIGF